MDPIPPAPAERAVNWKLVGRGLRRPGLWIVVLVTLTLASTTAAGYLYSRMPAPVPPEGGFRFDQVHVVQKDVDGNNTTFAIVPWFSNTATERIDHLRLVMYAIDQRGVSVAVDELPPGGLASRTTTNGTVEFRLDNRQWYRLEILVLEDGLLTARGQGSIGFHFEPHWDGEVRLDRANALSAGDFSYEYLPR